MRLPDAYIQNIASEFWAQACQQKSPPYDISRAVSLLFPIDIVCLCELSLEKIEKWLEKRGIKMPIDVNDRYLHGFVLAAKGNGFIFINGTDPEDERRYTIAHEISHFILDYKLPRDKVIEKLGESIAEVIDGLREPTIEERVSGLVKNVIVRPFTHLLEKEGDGSFETISIYNSESKADALALELLAPSTEIIRLVSNEKEKSIFSVFSEKCVDILINSYGLPSPIALQYALQLAYAVTGGPSIMNKLGF
jgi:hypothetical protein